VILVEKLIMLYEKYQDNINLWTFCIGEVWEVKLITKELIQDLINDIEYFGLIKATCRKGFIRLNDKQWKYN